VIILKESDLMPALNEQKHPLRDIAPSFNTFDVLWSRETSVSRVIAFFLHPHECHRQGSVFLELFAKQFLNQMDLGNLTDKWVRTWIEYEIPMRRKLDVLIEFSSGALVAIENKLFSAPDQHNQIAEYASWLNAESHGNFMLLYLTVSGCDPSEWSICQGALMGLKDAGRLKCIKYDEEFSNIFRRQCVEMEPSDVREFLKHFVDHLDSKRIFRDEMRV
jgi:hypothetical protein